MCEECLACKPNFKNSEELLNFKNFEMGAAHRISRLTHAEYLATSRTISPWSAVPGWHLRNQCRDIMHVVYLGTCRDLLASNIKVLATYDQLPGSAQDPLDDRLRQLSLQMVKECREAGIQINRKTFTRANLGMDRGNQYVELGSTFKAADIKAMVFFFTKLMVAKADELPQPEGRLIAICNWNLQRALCIFDAGSLLLSRSDAAEASLCLQRHLLTWQILAHRLSFLKCFYVRPKHHGIQHLAERLQANQLNARTYQCFDDESYLGRLKKLLSKCHGATTSKRGLQRYLLNLGLRFEASRSMARLAAGPSRASPA